MIQFISPAYQTLPILIPSLLLQTCPHWKLRICHDGPNQEFLKYCAANTDPRIEYYETTPLGYYGHPIRKILLEEYTTDAEYIVITNHDNYLCPTLVENILSQTEDIILWSIAHNYLNYQEMSPRIDLGRIDITQAAVKTTIAKQVGWQGMHHAADFNYIQECWKLAKNYKFINKILAVHN